MQQPLTVVCDGLRLAGGAYVPRSPKGTIVLLHGMPSAVQPGPDELSYAQLAERLARDGWAAVWGDLRSVRGSPGYFSIEGWVRDARALVERARRLEGAAGLPLGLVGTSAGGAVAAEAVRRGAPVDALVLLAAPAAWVSFAPDARSGAQQVIDSGMALSSEVLQDPSGWAKEFEAVTTERSIEHVRVPTLIVHGTADDVVPVDHAMRIAERAGDAQVEIIEAAGHNLRHDPVVMDMVQTWLEQNLPRPGS